MAERVRFAPLFLPTAPIPTYRQNPVYLVSIAGHLAMSLAETIESLRGSLQPIEELRDEQSQLEGWVQESFVSLEKLHEELSDWQGELVRQETEIDLREDALGKAQKLEGGLSEEVQQLRQQLTDARHELLQLEEENGQQLEELEDLERQQALLQAEVKTAHSRADELAAELQEEKQRYSEQQQQWTNELRQMRQLLEHQGTLLENLVENDSSPAPVETVCEPVPAETVEKNEEEKEAPSRSVELRRRAKARRAAKRREQGETEGN